MTDNGAALLCDALLPWEDAAVFLELLDAFHAEHRPKGPTGRALVDRLAWISWKRRRIRLAERALHMRSLHNQLTVSDGRQLAQRALVAESAEMPAVKAQHAISTTCENDAHDAAYNAAEAADLEKARTILEAGKTEASLNAALDCLRGDSREWWSQIVADLDAPHRPAELAERLLNFITGSLADEMTDQINAVGQRPAVRHQAWGQSLDPDRSARLAALDGELDRQFERVLRMLRHVNESTRNVG